MKKSKFIPLAKIKANQENPRIISESKLKKLVNSILVFPKMMELRPIVVDNKGYVLGGNMRLTALSRISQMSIEEIKEHLSGMKEFQNLEDGGTALLWFWEQFLEKPRTEVLCADDMTDDEKRQFIIKDNVSFGDWDYDELENWDSEQLDDWGVDMLMPDFGNQEDGGGNLPPELQGHDLLPDELKKIKGEDKTAMERVIICYYKKDEEKLAELLGVESIEKVVYNFDEIKNES